MAVLLILKELHFRICYKVVLGGSFEVEWLMACCIVEATKKLVNFCFCFTVSRMISC